MQQCPRIPREGTFAFGAFSASPSTLIGELKGQFDLPRPGVVAGFGPYRVVKDVESPPSWPAHRGETLPKPSPTGTVHFPPLASRSHPGLAVADAPALRHPEAQIDNATFSVRRSSAGIDGHGLSQARRQDLPTVRVRNGVADEESRPIIGLATVTPTNSIVLCRGRRARLGANHTKG